MADDTLTDASVWELAALVRERQLSPVELTAHFLARIQAHEGDLNAFTAAVRAYAAGEQDAAAAEAALQRATFNVDALIETLKIVNEAERSDRRLAGFGSALWFFAAIGCASGTCRLSAWSAIYARPMGRSTSTSPRPSSPAAGSRAI